MNTDPPVRLTTPLAVGFTDYARGTPPLLPLAEEPKKHKSVYETPCKDCCFAVYDDDTQVGCRFDRIRKFREKGVGVREVYDRDKEFFVVEAACLLHRHKKSPWAMANSGGLRMDLARGEIEIEVDVVVVMEEGHTVEDAKKTIDSLVVQAPVRPNKTTVVINRDGVKHTEITTFLPPDWDVQVLFERRPDGSRVSKRRCIDHAVSRSTAQFYAVFSPGFVVPDGFFNELDWAVNDRLERFVLLEPNAAGEGLVVQRRTHAYYGGNAEAVIESEDGGEDVGRRADSIEEKILHRARVENLSDLVKKVTEVCPSFPS